jgi:hypothetical protein
VRQLAKNPHYTQNHESVAQPSLAEVCSALQGPFSARARVSVTSGASPSRSSGCQVQHRLEWSLSTRRIGGFCCQETSRCATLRRCPRRYCYGELPGWFCHLPNKLCFRFRLSSVSLRQHSPNPGQPRTSRDVCDPSRRPCDAISYRESQQALGGGLRICWE